jgi:hypothetical protein
MVQIFSKVGSLSTHAIKTPHLIDKFPFAVLLISMWFFVKEGQKS